MNKVIDMVDFKSLAKRFRAYVCRKFGHSFSEVDMLLFEIESESHFYTFNTVMGKRTPLMRPPEIACRRCGGRLVGKEINNS